MGEKSGLTTHYRVRNVFEAATIGAMPDGQVAGDLGFETSFNTLYRWDGSTWQVLIKGYITKWVNPVYSDGGPDIDNGHVGHVLADAANQTVGFEFVVPYDFGTLAAALIVVKPEGTGDMYCRGISSYGAIGQSDVSHGTTGAFDAYAMSTDLINGFYIDAALLNIIPDIAANDFVGIQLNRDASHVSDTVGADVQVLGLYLAYVQR